MGTHHLSYCTCMVFAVVASCFMGTEAKQGKPGAQNGSMEACKDKEEGDTCEYSPFGVDYNLLFSYSHQQQLDKDLKEVLEDRGFAKKDWFNLLMIKSRKGKWLDLNFLHLPDIFDGGVTYNDFPVQVMLSEKWKGKCGGWGSTRGMCVGVRGPLVDACESMSKGDSCTYESLQLEHARLPDPLKATTTFAGKCMSTGEGVNWCKFMTAREQQIEACYGKLAGKMCEYSRNGKGYEDLNKGFCMGADGGFVLSCKGAKAALVDACDGKLRGDKCESENPPMKGWCGYGDATLTCMTKSDPPSAENPETKPEKPAPPSGGACSSLEDEVKSMRALLGKVAGKLGVSEAPPTVAPTTPSTRRRGGRRRRRKVA